MLVSLLATIDGGDHLIRKGLIRQILEEFRVFVLNTRSYVITLFVLYSITKFREFDGFNRSFYCKKTALKFN